MFIKFGFSVQYSRGAGMRLNPCEKWLVCTYFDLVSEGGGGGFLISPAILRNPLRPWDLCTPVRLLLDRISDRRGLQRDVVYLS
jgi:hypothetical protein